VGFVLTHVALIVFGIGARGDEVHDLLPRTIVDARALAANSSWMFVVALLLKAYSVGGGTYTGIEAVSNNVNMLAEPRVRTGKLTMLSMASRLHIPHSTPLMH